MCECVHLCVLRCGSLWIRKSTVLCVCELASALVHCTGLCDVCLSVRPSGYSGEECVDGKRVNSTDGWVKWKGS